jgi:hypothetical protein
MNQAALASRFDLVHERELELLLARGQTGSCTALVDLASGAVLSRGRGSENHPSSQVEFQAIVERLAALRPGDLISRLDIGGFAPHAEEIDGVTQRCQECICYLRHRKWCDLPELPVPVEPDWWCRLWKI